MPLDLVSRNSRPPDEHHPCPKCGPQCRTAANKTRKVMGVWHDANGTRTWCIRCGAKGYERRLPNRSGPSVQDAQKPRKDKSRAAAWLWSSSQPLKGTLGEVYLRKHRGIDLSHLPRTMRFKPAHDQYPAAIVTAYGLADGTEPDDLTIQNEVTAVHLTRLDENGRKLDKRMLGKVSGQPLCLAPINDAGGLAIAEGIEDALSVHQATGLGVWAAGSASHMAKLVDIFPDSVEVVTIIADPDIAGARAARALYEGLRARGIETRISNLEPEA